MMQLHRHRHHQQQQHQQRHQPTLGSGSGFGGSTVLLFENSSCSFFFKNSLTEQSCWRSSLLGTFLKPRLCDYSFSSALTHLANNLRGWHDGMPACHTTERWWVQPQILLPTIILEKLSSRPKNRNENNSFSKTVTSCPTEHQGQNRRSDWTKSINSVKPTSVGSMEFSAAIHSFFVQRCHKKAST